MTVNSLTVLEFLKDLPQFQSLPGAALQKLADRLQFLRYRMGQPILVREEKPSQIAIIYQGQARLLGYDPRTQTPVSLQRLEPGDVLGWVGLLRGIACETAIASSEVICLCLPAAEFLNLLAQEPTWAQQFRNRAGLIEVFELLGTELARRADGGANLKDLTLKYASDALVMNLPPGKTSLAQLDPNLLWLVSGGSLPVGVAAGARLQGGQDQTLEVRGTTPARLIGLREIEVQPRVVDVDAEVVPDTDDPWSAIPYAPDRPAQAASTEVISTTEKFPFVGARGPLDATMACFQMLSRHLNIPFRRDTIRRVLKEQSQRTGKISLQLCGAVSELMGLNAQLATVPAIAIGRIPTPALIGWHDSFALVYKATDQEVVLAIPEEGIRRQKPADFAAAWGTEGEVLLLKAVKETPKQKFGLGWFWPSIVRHKKVLIEVLIASFFVQLFSLANPLVTQVIIDKVLIQNSIDTLHILGILLVVVAVFEAVLTSLRTYLFVDTTNRIDLTLGSEIIDHLVRLPLRYFDRRPVGELATRVNELENIRQFLTGTALTVVLDAVFSVIYIVVMFFYSWLLTIVALATVPLFAVLTYIFAPIVRQQLRTKAERNAQTQSYLVEVLSGIQTVKAQNIELRSRWQWQDRYARYVSAGFQNVLTSTTAGSMSNFLNKLSGLLLLWVGAYLVLKQQLSLGQLIAFRIIAGYATSPLLRLVQLWQNFQETALSLERLSDIIDNPQEADETNRDNIPMPLIKGAVTYDDVSFRFANAGALQLININLDFPAGTFVGVVGQSGSGKSTLMKLLQRLYEPLSGRILIDNYDISKVELYSLRRQIGMVLQDTLLFDGTVQENIALTKPDASTEEIVAAAQVAFAHDFIMSLPNGYNTRVGERGAGLSGGQRQRIAIARTVLQNPQLLILDEATSALDYNTERQVCLNLAEAFKGRTVFFITHRLTTIKNADVILMMDQGSVVEQGTHDELMALRGRYYCLYQQQEAQL